MCTIRPIYIIHILLELPTFGTTTAPMPTTTTNSPTSIYSCHLSAQWAIVALIPLIIHIVTAVSQPDYAQDVHRIFEILSFVVNHIIAPVMPSQGGQCP